MKLLRFQTENGPHLGLALGGLIYDLCTMESVLPGLSLPQTMLEAIEKPPAFWQALRSAFEGKPGISQEGIRFLPCVEMPQKILCVGLNYHDHASEVIGNTGVPEEPVIFSKMSNTLAAHGQTIPMPGCGVQIDYEVELVLVVGKRAKNLSPENAMDAIFGYTVGNDLSVREPQFRTSQWLLGKSADSFGPVGPWIVPRDSLDIGALDVTCTVNGQVRQHSNTRHMMFPANECVAHISRHMTLEPGDLIYTGTPAGVAMGYPEGQQPWLKPGDLVVCEIEGIGRLENTIGH